MENQHRLKFNNTLKKHQTSNGPKNLFNQMLFWTSSQQLCLLNLIPSISQWQSIHYRTFTSQAHSTVLCSNTLYCRQELAVRRYQTETDCKTKRVNWRDSKQLLHVPLWLVLQKIKDPRGLSLNKHLSKEINIQTMTNKYNDESIVLAFTR